MRPVRPPRRLLPILVAGLLLAACAPSATTAQVTNATPSAPKVTPSALATSMSVASATVASVAATATVDPPTATPSPEGAVATSTPAATTRPPAPAGYPGQSNLVPPGFPTPNTAYARLYPGGPPRDPGPLTWAHPGPYIGPTWTNFALHIFTSAQRLATTYYFYWHDFTNPARLSRFDSQFGMPPDAATYTFLSSATHLKQFQDMTDAGLDFVLPVYWGEPGHPGRTTDETSPHYWSTEGIPAMVKAMDQLHAAGGALQMGMFYDTTILANADLTTPDGMAYFYVNIRDYYSRIPPQYWAAIDGHPIVWLYDTLWVSKFDQASIDYVTRHFAQDFGGLTPYIVLESQWEHSKGVTPPQDLHASAFYGWGAAANGYNPDPKLTVAEVGPGFNNTAYCRGGPSHNCFDVGRGDGSYYVRQLQDAVASSRRIMAVETWNEFSEGTNIAETVQDGRKYIDLTREYANQFKATG